MSSLLDFDRAHVWHPYTSITNPLPVYEASSAEGVNIHLSDGRTLIDGMSSWWAAIHGYNHPILNKAIEDQLAKMSHVMFGGITHEPAIELAHDLITMTPDPLDLVFFCDSGSVSVEVAIKMSLQYWQAKEQKKKTKLLTVRGGYHGDTFGAMAVCDPISGMHHLFQDVMPHHIFSPKVACGFYDSWDESYASHFADLVHNNHKEIAAVILEPVVQGAGGMYFYNPEFLTAVRQLCDQYNILLILDEIATGFGRTGELFGFNHAGICPDIMCLGKALTGGYLSLAATLSTLDVGQVISSKDPGLFMHGPTFMGNPLACSVARASLQLLCDSPWRQMVKDIETTLKKELLPCQEFPHVKDVRVLGAIGVVEMKETVDVAWMQKEFVDRGVWIRPFGKLVYVMPPYIINPKELEHLTRSMVEVIGLAEVPF
jgi:adenosylmethionine---8-amino-7-oxononanoate aminotransferase